MTTNNSQGAVAPLKRKFKVPTDDAVTEQPTAAPASFQLGRSSQQLTAEKSPFKTCAEAALYWHGFGFDVMPVISHSKTPALQWDPWFRDLSQSTIAAHWFRCPFHDLGFKVGDNLIVFDADSPESIAALVELEKAHGITPNMVVRTNKGEHHYFKRSAGTFAKSDAHSTKEHPDRLDVKTGRAMIILPPSTGKTLVLCEAKTASELVEVGQGFIDAVFEHNGKPAPRQADIAISANGSTGVACNDTGMLNALLDTIDPDSGGYQKWLDALMAIYHETGGSEAGFEIAVAWSERGKSYKGEKEIRTKWNSFKSGTANPITIATLHKMSKESGGNLKLSNGSVGEEFEVCETVVFNPAAKSAVPEVIKPTIVENTGIVDSDKQVALINPFDQFSLRGMSDEMEKHIVAAEPLLDQIALMGQVTVYFAKGNVGKTVITFKLLLDAIKLGLVDSNNIYYLNMDDTSTGLVEKNRIAEEYGFHMLAEGHREFSAADFKNILRVMIENDQAKGIVLILDTLKKFVNLMDKNQTSAFTNLIRPFVSKGGTVIALAHTNKNPDKNGNPVYGGVSDIMNDIDCAYTIAEVSAENGLKVVEFVNVKRRGNVVYNASYSYCYGNTVTYHELLASVQAVDDTQLDSLKLVEEIKSDTEVIDAVKACINSGVNTKMKLVDAVSKHANISKRSAEQVIEKYTGADPALHRWNYSRGERGMHVFFALPPTQPVEAALPTPPAATPDSEMI